MTPLSLKHLTSGPGTLPVVEQIYHALLKEIEAGRWTVGQVLPNPEVLAKNSEVSRSSVARAYQRLAEEGYIERTKRKGSVLLSTHPAAKRAGGSRICIGIALPNPSDKSLFRSAEYANHLLYACIDHLKSQDIQIEVSNTPDTLGRSERYSVEALFEVIPDGILSIGPLPQLTDSRGRIIPVVYIHRSANHLRPCALGDTEIALAQATNLAIEHGHREIACLGDAASIHESRIRFLHHARVMEANGLTPNQEAFEDSLQSELGLIRNLDAYLKKYTQTTCFLSLHRAATATSFASGAVSLGYRIPEDLSLISYGACEFTGEQGSQKITALDHDVSTLVAAALETLLKMIQAPEQTPYSPLIPPYQSEGSTLGRIDH